jgi:hypothetical protein
MKLLLSLFLVLSLNTNANVFDDIGSWFEGAANDTGDWFVGAYNDVSYFAGHNPGISMLGGLAVVKDRLICSKVDSQVQKFSTRYQRLIVL